MRKIVMQMMTTLNGRLDSPFEWVDSVQDDLFGAIDTWYGDFDTLLVGRVTFEEMVSYWPGALQDAGASPANRRMAQKMNDYKKVVVSNTMTGPASDWKKATCTPVQDDDQLKALVVSLKRQPGRDIHLAGGASLAQNMASLGLVDEHRFFVHPVFSPGATWFAGLTAKQAFTLAGTRRFSGDVIEYRYLPSAVTNSRVAEHFSELVSHA